MSIPGNIKVKSFNGIHSEFHGGYIVVPSSAARELGALEIGECVKLCLGDADFLGVKHTAKWLNSKLRPTENRPWMWHVLREYCSDTDTIKDENLYLEYLEELNPYRGRDADIDNVLSYIDRYAEWFEGYKDKQKKCRP